MKYILAKQLKDAGFPEGKEGKLIDGEDCDVCGYHVYYVPTLSELIEACGDEFCELVQSDHYKLWIARGDVDWPKKLPSYNLLSGEGLTPEEAVANLYIALKETN